MKKLILLLILMNNAHAITVISEETWFTGSAVGYIKKTPMLFSNIQLGDVAKATTYLVDQQGYQGLENTIGATHTFYAYNGNGSSTLHTFTAKLCDVNNNCFNYEKKFRLDWGQYYGETIYSSLKAYGKAVGRYPIYAQSDISGSANDHSHKEASLLLAPFPYDS